MRKLVVLVLFSAIALALPSAAQAATITLASYTVTDHSSGNGLLITSTNVAPPNYVVNMPTVGTPVSFNLFNIGTAEGSVEFGEDTVAKPITVAMTFVPAAVGPSLGGTTVGFYQLNPFASNFGNCNLFVGGCGKVTWTAPSIFNFGTTGQFKVDLANVQFKTPGNANVAATFTLLNEDVAPVPEPASMILLGTGLLYGAQRRWRKKA